MLSGEAALRLYALGIAAIGLLAAPGSALGQGTAANPVDLKALVLDRVLPLGGESRPRWCDKLTVRFSNSIGDFGDIERPDGQLVLVTYPVDPPTHPEPESELISYRVKSATGGDLSKLIMRMLEQNPSVSADEIASAVVVDTERRPLALADRDRLFRRLRKITLPPVLRTRICLDNCPRYDFWHDTGQERVHFSLVGHPGKDRDDDLKRWMEFFLSSYFDNGEHR